MKNKWLWSMVINMSIVIGSITLNIFSKNYTALIAWVNTGLWIFITFITQKRMHQQQEEISDMWTENIDYILSRFKIEEVQKWLRKKKLENLKNKE